MGGHQPSMGAPSVKYGGVISQVWGAISQVWGVHQPTMGGPSAKYGGVINQLWGGAISQVGGVSHQYVQEVKIHRITLATHMSCRL